MWKMEEYETHENSFETLTIEGNLHKWTNYILGWKIRFFSLSQGRLTYSINKIDAQLSSRGSIDVTVATIVPSKLDDRCFNVQCFDVTWYLRASTTTERHRWIETLFVLSRQNLISSPTNYRDVIRRKFEEIRFSQKTLSKRLVGTQRLVIRDSFVRPSIIEVNNEVEALRNSSASFLIKIVECVETILTSYQNIDNNSTPVASEFSIDEEFVDNSEVNRYPMEGTSPSIDDRIRLLEIIARESEQEIQSARSEIDSESWIRLDNVENLTIFTKETVESDGLVIDPLRATCSVEGVTGKEACHYFFHPQFRKDLEPSVERIEIVERFDDSILLLHQTYKRVWPAAQRDILFWSKLTRVDDAVWAVVNKSVEHPRFPPGGNKIVRAKLTVCLLCETIVRDRTEDRDVDRGNLSCQMTYCAVVHPGGWVPATVVRALRRREYPKFLNKFTAYVKEKTKSQRVLM